MNKQLCNIIFNFTKGKEVNWKDSSWQDNLVSLREKGKYIWGKILPQEIF